MPKIQTELVVIKGLDGVLKTLREMPPEIVSKRGGPVRRALRKASKLMVDEMKANVQKIMDEPNIGYSDVHTGVLKKNIYTKRVALRGKHGEMYRVGVRIRKKYPRKSAGQKKDVTVVQVGRQLETGTERRDPMPWVRPAFDARKGEVIPLFVSALNRDIALIQKKLAAKNGVAR